MNVSKNIIQTAEVGERLDAYLAKKTGITRSQIQKIIEKGDVRVNEKPVSQSYKIKKGDIITVISEENEPEETLIPEMLPIDIFYQDDYIVVVNKPATMVVYPAAGHSHGTLMNAIAYYCKKRASVGAPLRPGVVHRLDKDTSGVMVIALDDEAYYSLVEQFRQRTIQRNYIVLIDGELRGEGEIATKIGRSASNRKKMSTRMTRGKEALTKWKVLERFKIATLVEVKLGTGRTHQIRVHFASIGHSVLGDRTYGKKVKVEVEAKKEIIFPRQMLHAAMLGFTHPVTGEYLKFSSQIPDDMNLSIQELKGLRKID